MNPPVHYLATICMASVAGAILRYTIFGHNLFDIGSNRSPEWLFRMLPSSNTQHT